MSYLRDSNYGEISKESIQVTVRIRPPSEKYSYIRP